MASFTESNPWCLDSHFEKIVRLTIHGQVIFGTGNLCILVNGEFIR